MNRATSFLLLWLALLNAAIASAAPYLHQSIVPVTINDTVIELPYRVSIESQANNGAQQLTALISVPLDPMLPALQQALERQRPRNNCAKHGENWVVEPPQLALSVEGGRLKLAVNAEVELWGCIDLFGRDAKTIAANGLITVQLTGNWQLEAQSLRLAVDVSDVRVGGSLVDVAKVFALAKGQTLADTLTRELRRESLPELPLPQALIGLGAEIESARFVQLGGVHAAEITLHATLMPQDWHKLLSGFFSPPTP